MTSGDTKKRSQNSAVTIEVADLEREPLVVDTPLPLEWLTERMTACEYDAAPLNASVKLNVSSSCAGIWIKGRVFSNVKTQCGTCAKDIVIGIESMINSYLLPRSAMQEEHEATELTPEELEREYYDGETVTLDELLGDAVMLELPMNPKCESACRGLEAFSEQSVSAVPSIDPRLAPLMGIRINKEN